MTAANFSFSLSKINFGENADFVSYELEATPVPQNPSDVSPRQMQPSTITSGQVTVSCRVMSYSTLYWYAQSMDPIIYS